MIVINKNFVNVDFNIINYFVSNITFYICLALFKRFIQYKKDPDLHIGDGKMTFL